MMVFGNVMMTDLATMATITTEEDIIVEKARCYRALIIKAIKTVPPLPEILTKALDLAVALKATEDKKFKKGEYK